LFSPYAESPADTTTTTTPAPTQLVTATHKGTLTLTVDVTAEMSTTGRLVVYYIRPDGEVVADGIDFNSIFVACVYYIFSFSY